MAICRHFAILLKFGLYTFNGTIIMHIRLVSYCLAMCVSSGLCGAAGAYEHNELTIDRLVSKIASSGRYAFTDESFCRLLLHNEEHVARELAVVIQMEKALPEKSLEWKNCLIGFIEVVARTHELHDVKDIVSASEQMLRLPDLDIASKVKLLSWAEGHAYTHGFSSQSVADFIAIAGNESDSDFPLWIDLLVFTGGRDAFEAIWHRADRSMAIRNGVVHSAMHLVVSRHGVDHYVKWIKEYPDNDVMFITDLCMFHALRFTDRGRNALAMLVSDSNLSLTKRKVAASALLTTVAGIELMRRMKDMPLQDGYQIGPDLESMIAESNRSGLAHLSAGLFSKLLKLSYTENDKAAIARLALEQFSGQRFGDEDSWGRWLQDHREDQVYSVIIHAVSKNPQLLQVFAIKEFMYSLHSKLGGLTEESVAAYRACAESDDEELRFIACIVLLSEREADNAAFAQAIKFISVEPKGRGAGIVRQLALSMDVNFLHDVEAWSKWKAETTLK